MTNNEQQLAELVVARMLETDALTRWLGMELLEVAPRRCVGRMVVRPEMVNGFGVAHGGIVFSFADSAFAFACNTSGFVTVSIENSVTYPAAIHPGDVLTAVAVEEAASKKLGYYRWTSATSRARWWHSSVARRTARAGFTFLKGHPDDRRVCLRGRTHAHRLVWRFVE